MGARISVTIKEQNIESPTICFHWGGEAIKELVEDYKNQLINYLNQDNSIASGMPLGRLEANTVFVDFVGYALKNYYYNGDVMSNEGHILGDIYIVKDKSECDDSDYGNITIDCEKLRKKLKTTL